MFWSCIYKAEKNFIFFCIPGEIFVKSLSQEAHIWTVEWFRIIEGAESFEEHEYFLSLPFLQY